MRRINKYVKWGDKEYAHIIEEEPAEFCSMCALCDICSQVAQKKITFDNSPMAMCDELCSAENTNYAFFIESDKAEAYCNKMN